MKTKHKNQSDIDISFHIDKSFYAISGYPIDGVALRRHPNKYEILDSTEEYLKNPIELIKQVKANPDLMKSKPGIVIAVYILAERACAPKSEYSKKAADILREIGRKDLLPRTHDGKPETNKTENAALYYWSHNLEDLFDEVDEYKEKLLELFDNCPNKSEHNSRRLNSPKELWTPRNGKKVYVCCLDNAFKLEIGRPRPIEFDKLRGDLNQYLGLTVIRFFHYKYNVPFYSLWNLYYENSDKGKLKFKPKTAKEAVEFRKKKLFDKESKFERVIEEKDS